jgi:hypothetical protein
MQDSAFQAEMNQQRKEWLFEKEKNSYTDRRERTMDENSARAADERGAELFRREGYLNQSEYDRRIHYSARSHMTEKSTYGVKQNDKKESDVAAAGDNGGGDSDDADGNDEEGRPSFSPYLD